LLIFPNPTLDRQIEMALAEDIGPGDITTDNLIPVETQSKGKIWAKENGVIAGLPVVERVYEMLGGVRTTPKKEDGELVDRGETLLTLEGNTRSILKGERLALNFLQRLSGIATQTARVVEKTAGYNIRVVDTRKTTPLWRTLEKYAVIQGGGHNHRLGLYDSVLIKDNHIEAVGSVKEAVKRAKEKVGHTVKVEVEVKKRAQIDEALEAGADIILLDNMSLEEMSDAVKKIGKKAIVEASGNITVDNANEIAKTGVDVISLGALTHSVRALDISLDLF